MYDYRCTILKVVDGDTLHCEVDLGCDVSIELTIRLAGLDCPEHGTPEGDAATAFTAAWIAQRQPGGLVLETLKDKREKYGRYLGTLVGPDGVETLNLALLAAGHAVEYNGGKRP